MRKIPLARLDDADGEVQADINVSPLAAKARYCLLR
jgi:hypothetical protein